MELGIGYFGDTRRERSGELLARRVSDRQTVCLRKLADDRAEQIVLVVLRVRLHGEDAHRLSFGIAGDAEPTRLLAGGADELDLALLD